MSDQTARRYAPLAVAALVLVVIAGVWLGTRGGTSGAGPGSGGGVPVLELAGWSPAGGGEADPRFVLAEDADLPDGPDGAPVLDLDVAGDGDLRAALDGLAASLVVDPSGQWSAGQASCGVVTPDSAVSSDATTVPCTLSDSVGGPTEVTTGSADPDAVWRALGLDGRQAVVEPDTLGGGVQTRYVDPVVAGLPTTGLRTTLVVRDGTVLSGQGWLVRAAERSTYPVLSAPDAFQLLRTTPLPMPLMACPEPLPEGSDPVPCGGPVTVTGARIGLSLQQDPQGQLLVPAWLFDVEGSSYPLVQVAVPPRLLAPADQGGGSTGSPGSVVPPVPPTAPSPTGSPLPPEQPPDPASRFADLTVSADGRSLGVTFWGGVDECYSYRVRAVEDDRTVRLWVVEDQRDGATVCIEIAEEKRQTVTLDEPLGSRRVVDGETGAVLQPTG